MRSYSLLLCLLLFLGQSQAFSEQLVIISPHWEGIRYEFEAGFGKWRQSKGLPAVSISWRDIGGTSEIVRFVQSEFQGTVKTADNTRVGIGIDLVFGGGVDPFVTFKRLGLLEQVNLPLEVLAPVAPEVSGAPLYDPEHFWFAPTMSAFGIFCNKKVLETLGIEAPKTWEDLLKPEFKTWITSADPRRSGSAHMYYEIILQAYGWKQGWQVLFGLAQNYRTFLANSSQVILDVVNGEVACGFAIDSQANSQISNSKANEFSFVVPSERSLFNGDGMAVLRGAPNLKAAREFVEYSLSPQAQKLFYLPKGSSEGPIKYELNRLPVLSQLFEYTTLQSLNPFINSKDAKSFSFDSELSSNRWEALNDLLGVFVIEAKDAGRIQNNQCQGIVPSEDQIKLLLANGTWVDQVERNKIISEWRRLSFECTGESWLSIQALPFLIILLGLAVVLIGGSRLRDRQ